MSNSEYVFNIGDEVITVDGEKGKIVDICDCMGCKKRGFCEPIDISEAESTIEWADDREYIKINSPKEFTLTCYDTQFNREWTLAYCRICGSPFPIIQFDAFLYGTDRWTCPLCTVIERVKRGVRR